MDTTNVEKIISCITGIVTLLSTVYGVFSFRKQKNYERSEKALTEFYVPLLRTIEKHLYTSDYTSQSFLKLQCISYLKSNTYLFRLNYKESLLLLKKIPIKKIIKFFVIAF